MAKTDQIRCLPETTKVKSQLLWMAYVGLSLTILSSLIIICLRRNTALPDLISIIYQLMLIKGITRERKTWICVFLIFETVAIILLAFGLGLITVLIVYLYSGNQRFAHKSDFRYFFTVYTTIIIVDICALIYHSVFCYLLNRLYHRISRKSFRNTPPVQL